MSSATTRGVDRIAQAGTGALAQTGNIVHLFVDVARQTFVRPFQWREFIQQAWFIASVTIVPTALVAIPFTPSTVAVDLPASLVYVLAVSGIGTVATLIAGRRQSSVRTTPEAPELHALFARMREAGVDTCAMEVSSHAVSYQRIAGLRYAVAGFTNLTQDHLDFHPTMADYFAAKATLFTSVEIPKPKTSIRKVVPRTAKARRIRSRASSSAAVFVKPMTPCFAAT